MSSTAFTRGNSVKTRHSAERALIRREKFGTFCVFFSVFRRIRRLPVPVQSKEKTRTADGVYERIVLHRFRDAVATTDFISPHTRILPARSGWPQARVVLFPSMEGWPVLQAGVVTTFLIFCMVFFVTTVPLLHRSHTEPFPNRADRV